MRRFVYATLAIGWISAVVAAEAPPPAGSIQYRPMQYGEGEWHGSTYWTAGGWARVGKDWQHPGDNGFVIRRFTLPEDGTVTISGRVAKGDTGGGDGVEVEIRLDDKAVWSDRIEARDAKGRDLDLRLDIRKGQSLRFAVAAGPTISYDTTAWDPVVTYANGARHQASAGFSNEQGKNGWWYESDGKKTAVLADLRPQRQPKTPPAKGQPKPAPVLVPDMHGLDLPAMVEIEWLLDDGLSAEPRNFGPAVATHMTKATQLLADLQAAFPAGALDAEKTELGRLADKAAQANGNDRELYLQVRWLKRKIALKNPLLKFERLLFTKRVPTSYSHLVMQCFGWRARPGGGLFILEEPGRSVKVRDILAGKLSTGNVFEPSLSYDGKRIVFAYVELRDFRMRPEDNRPGGEDRGYYHVYTVNVDGSDLRQVTSGPYDDLMPTWLPDGGIAFSSTRRKGYARCFGGQFGNRWHVYTLHRVEADGGRLRQLSFHDTNEWFPSVTNAGQIVYARWDYIDRDAVTHQNLWLTRPDGTNPVALWGNATPKPHCSFQAKAVPGSNKLLFVASAHHSATGGSLVLLDPAVDNNSAAAIRRLTPTIAFPEAEGRSAPAYYASPWPLSEKYFLVAYSPLPLVYEAGAAREKALGLYLFDAQGNRELIYRDPDIGCEDPIPLVARQSPPILPTTLPADAPPVGAMLLSDVYRGLGDVPRERIRQLRIVQILPKLTPTANNPPIGVAGEENARAVLGTVPVEADGSAHFEVPAGKPILFQALDADGFAYQTMRTITYVQPGERVSCSGCHESRMTAVPNKDAIAARRSPSKIDPGPLGGAPFSYVRFVQPVLDKHCVRCHGRERTDGNVDLTGQPAAKGPFTRSYVALTQKPAMVPRYGARNQIQTTSPGGVQGALGSGLMRLLRAEHEGVKLSDAELRTLAAWIDLNAVFFGSYDRRENECELRGEPLPMPPIQ
ncbi:MAG: hypothetical protein ABR915_03415 [Thermoguttaceae bacterium]|jgi:hypothetical protein